MSRWRINGGIIGKEISYSDGDSGVWSLESPYLNLNVVPPGEALFVSTNINQLWTVPSGVTSIACVCIGGGGGGSASTLASNGISGGGGGGGGLHWRNLTVTPGQQFRVLAGYGGQGGTGAGSNSAGNGQLSRIMSSNYSTYYLRANGGTKGSYAVSNSGSVSGGSTFFGTYGGGGGNGGFGRNGANGNGGGGGGGAGGYSGNGGTGGYYNSNGTSGSGGAGGGGGACNGFTSTVTAGGGGTSPYGEGSSGAFASANNTGNQISIQGFRGSPVGGGATASKTYGGGGTGAEDDSGNGGGAGANGVVRIIWGTDRLFPSSNTAESFSDGNITIY